MQESEAFTIAVGALKVAESQFGTEVTAEQVERLCTGMVEEEPAGMNGVVIVHTPAVYGIERSFMIFGVRDSRVLLVNPRPDGSFRFGLQPGYWNAFLDSASVAPSLTDGRSVRQYGCLLLKYLGNYMPGDPCGGEEAADVNRVGASRWRITFPRFRWSIEVSDSGRVIGS